MPLPLVTDGLVERGGQFHSLRVFNTKPIEQRFRKLVLDRLRRAERLSESFQKTLLCCMKGSCPPSRAKSASGYRRTAAAMASGRTPTLAHAYRAVRCPRIHVPSSSSESEPSARPRKVAYFCSLDAARSWPFKMRKVRQTTNAVRLFPSRNG